MCIYHATFFVCGGQALFRTWTCDLPHMCLPHIQTVLHRPSECRLCSRGRAAMISMCPEMVPTAPIMHAWMPVYTDTIGIWPWSANYSTLQAGRRPVSFEMPCSPNNDRGLCQSASECQSSELQTKGVQSTSSTGHSTAIKHVEVCSSDRREEGNRVEAVALFNGHDGTITIAEENGERTRLTRSAPAPPKHPNLNPTAPLFHMRSHDDDDEAAGRSEARSQSCPAGLLEGPHNNGK